MCLFPPASPKSQQAPPCPPADRLRVPAREEKPESSSGCGGSARHSCHHSQPLGSSPLRRSCLGSIPLPLHWRVISDLLIYYPFILGASSGQNWSLCLHERL